jgi:ketosteroid isomerase-like protein
VAAHKVRALEERVSEVLSVLDSVDPDRLAAMCADDVHRVDEISRGWRRGPEAFDDLEDSVDEVHSTIEDVVIRTWDSTGLVTCVIDQTSMIGEEEQRLTASPTTMVFRLEEDDWKLVLFHSVPVR